MTPPRPPQPPPPSTTPPQPPKTAKDEAIAWLKAIGTAFLIWVVLRSFLVEAFRIPSASMENTLLIGDFLFVNKAVFGGELEIPLTGIHCCRLPAFATPQRGAVVVFRSVEDSTPDLNIVKRVMGAPGDTLQMVHDTVFRNGQRLDEPYALHTALTPVP
ncbi:MAG TPA: signal peptidase I, partial [Gemmatimonadales bacterium]|nr:signal peptidase I [Gemmatimonadales bacterium]